MSSSDLFDPSVAEKSRLKRLIRQWEQDWEESHGGLVATHEDKKDDPRYKQLKMEAKRVEMSRKATKKAAKSPPQIAGSHTAQQSQQQQQNGWLRMPNATLGLSKFPSSSAIMAGGTTRPHPETDARYAFEGGRISLSPFHVILLMVACAVPYALLLCIEAAYIAHKGLHDSAGSSPWE